MSRQIASFKLGDTTLGVDILLMKEVYRSTVLTPIPDAPEHLRGLMNLRGRVVTIIDLNVCLNRPASRNIDDSCLLILKTGEEIISYQNQGCLMKTSMGEDIVGLLIDRMDDVLEVEEEQILPPPPNLDTVEEEMIEGVIKREKLVILLNITSVLERVMSSAVEA